MKLAQRVEIQTEDMSYWADADLETSDSEHETGLDDEQVMLAARLPYDEGGRQIRISMTREQLAKLAETFPVKK